MSKIKSFILGSIEEIRHKVAWPPYNEIQSSSMLVLTASFVFAVLIGVIDFALKNAVAWFYNAF
jgi:preprotein translocase subunit SecE